MPRKVLRSPRLARQEKKRKQRKALFISALTFLLFAGLSYGFFRPEFRISTIEVSGFARVPEESIRASVVQGLQGSYLGFIPKKSTLLYPRAALKETLLREFPAFSGVSLSLQNLATLRVAVHEREPVVQWCSDTFGCFLVDETGFVFAKAPLEAERLYFRLEKTATSSPLGTVAITSEKLAELISLSRQLELLELDPEVIRILGENELEVVLREGARILLRVGDQDEAILRLQTLLRADDVLPKSRGKLGITYIDLRYGNKIYFK